MNQRSIAPQLARGFVEFEDAESPQSGARRRARFHTTEYSGQAAAAGRLRSLITGSKPFIFGSLLVKAKIIWGYVEIMPASRDAGRDCPSNGGHAQPFHSNRF